MANRRLTAEEISELDDLQGRTVSELERLSKGDPELLFALRRRLFTRLMHMERGTPAHRKKLKAEKWREQNGLCAICREPMEMKGSELDRAKASFGYTKENTRLLHHACHVADQAAKGFTDREIKIVERIDDLVALQSGKDEAEVRIGGVWRSIDILDALALQSGELMRCPECHGQVRAHKASVNGMRAHFEHYVAHAGCPLKGSFWGMPSPHPDALK